MTLKDEQENTYPRRDFVKKVAYTAPLIVTLAVKPAVAKTGSGNQDGNSQGGNSQG
jgi:hypothetical protein